MPMPETRVQPLAQENPTCLEAAKSVHHNYWVCALEALSLNHLQATAKKQACPSAMLCKEKPLQWEAVRCN